MVTTHTRVDCPELGRQVVRQVVRLRVRVDGGDD